MKWAVVPASIVLAFSSVLAFADLTLKGSGSGSGLGMSASGETAIYIKDGRMRSDWTQGAKSQSMILDLDHQRMIVLDHAKKKAEVFDLAKLAADLKAIPDGDMKVEIKPTGKTRSILGRTCQEFLLRIVVPYADPSGMSVDTILSGPAWIAKDSPGAADYRSFYLKAAQKGLFFNHPAAAKAQPGRAKGMTALYKELAKLGVPYASDIRVDFQGTGLLAQMMSKMGEVKSGSTVSQVSTAPLSDHLFEQPAGYKIKAK